MQIKTLMTSFRITSRIYFWDMISFTKHTILAMTFDFSRNSKPETFSRIFKKEFPEPRCFFFLLFFLEQITDRQIDLFYNLGQDVADKFTKLSKIGFSIDCFTADCLRLFTVKRQNLAFGWTTGYSPSNPSISGIFLKFPNFLRS